MNRIVIFCSATPMVTWVTVAADMGVVTPIATIMEDLDLVVLCLAFPLSKDLLIQHNSQGRPHTLRTAVHGILSRLHSKSIC